MKLEIVDGEKETYRLLESSDLSEGDSAGSESVSLLDAACLGSMG